MNKILLFFKNNFKDIFKPVIVLFGICIIIPLALALTNAVTLERITELSEKSKKETMQKLIVAEEYADESYSENGKAFDYNVAKNSGRVEGYIFNTFAKGYGGTVSVMTAIDSEGKIIEVAILDVSSETPGLGQNASKKSFYSQYEDKNGNIELIVKAKPESGKNQVMAISGATITSKAINGAVNEALDNFKLINEHKDSEVTQGEE